MALAPPRARASPDPRRSHLSSAAPLVNPSGASIRILLVDDDADFAELVRRSLGKRGIDVEYAPDAPAARRLLEGPDGTRIDLVLLDVQMPRQSGWEALEQWRLLGRDTPVIFLTGLDDVEQRVKGLNLGADDYVAKSLQFEELLARILAVVRRHRTRAVILNGDLELDLVRRIVRRAARTLELSNREFDLLRVMASHPGRTFSRARLLDLVWGIRFDP